MTRAVSAFGDAQGDEVAVAVDHFAVAGEIARAVLEYDRDRLPGGDGVGQRTKIAVEEDLPVVDDDDALAQRLDVGHVVTGQHHGRLVPLPIRGDELADPLLHRHVEPDGRLVEEEHLRPVEQRADDLDLHPLTQRELAHRLAHEVADLEELDQLVAAARGSRRVESGRSSG